MADKDSAESYKKATQNLEDGIMDFGDVSPLSVPDSPPPDAPASPEEPMDDQGDHDIQSPAPAILETTAEAEARDESVGSIPEFGDESGEIAAPTSPEPFHPPEPDEPPMPQSPPVPDGPPVPPAPSHDADVKPPEPTEPEPDDHITLDPEEVVAEAIQRDMNRASLDAKKPKKPGKNKEGVVYDHRDETNLPKTEVKEEKSNSEKKSPELEKYWKAVRSNPCDFTGWTYLLQYVEQENKIDFAREAFDEFFRLFPYCYGYWKKYADMEKRHDNLDKSKEIYERGLKAIPLSVDLWTHYLNFATIHLSGDDYEKTIRTLYERAVSASGMDFRSDKLWNQYIAWEKEMGDLRRITAIYDRLLRIPTQLYAQHDESFKKFVNENHPKEILDLDEFLRLRQEVVASLSERGDLDTLASVEEEDDDDEAPPGMEPVAAKKKFDAAEVQLVREKIIAIRAPYHKANEEEVSKRWTFEEGIRRPYFHVKPLERAQLKNWKDYLDFEVENGSHIRAVVLFERCMIACAQYEEFWMKYAQYLEPHSIEGVRNVFRRGCTIHLTKKPNLHLAWAAFEERNGNCEEAWEILKNIENALPGMAMLGMRRIGLERRQGNHQEAEQLFNEYLDSAKTTPLKVFYAVKYARFASKILKDKEKAVHILEEALESDPNNYRIIFQLIDLEFVSEPMREGRVMELFQKICSNDQLSADVRISFSRRRLEFMEDHGSDITRVMGAYNEHQQMLKELAVKEPKKKSADRESSKEKDASHRSGSGHKRSSETDDVSSKKRSKYETNGSSTSSQYNYGQQWNYAGSNASQYAYGDGGWSSYNSAYSGY